LDWIDNHCSCGDASSAGLLFDVTDHLAATTSERASFLRCGACGSVFPDRFPEEESLTSAYQGYYTGAPGGKRRAAWLRALMNASRHSYLRRDLPENATRLLDYGCGSGAYLSSISRSAPRLEAFGTDNRQLLGPAGFAWLTPESIEDHGPYDWITMGHVLEHVVEPGMLIGRLAGLLSAGGGMWIATPNADSFLLASAGRWARDVDFPRHREIFSAGALERLLADHGLHCERVSPPLLNAAINAFATLGTVAGDRSSSILDRTAAAFSVVFSLAGHALRSSKRRLRSSPELIVIARKVRGHAGH
jgi:hypothetical protein